MTSLVTSAQVNMLGAGGGLSDTDLQAVIDWEEAELVRRLGAHYSAGSRTVTRPGGGESIFLNRAIGSVSAITEYYYLGDPAGSVLPSTLYYVWPDQGRIQRLGDTYGGLARWGASVGVTYTPQDDTNLRKQVLIELVRITVSQRVAGKVSGLGYSVDRAQKGADWQRDRAEQYNRLSFIGV